MIMDDYDDQMIFGDLGGLKLPDICLTGEEKPRENLTQETCPDRGSNPGPLRDRRSCYRLPHSSGPLFMLEGFNAIIRRTDKEIISLPHRTESGMFYAPCKLRGPGIVYYIWEYTVQHLSTSSKLNNYEYPPFLKIL